MGAKHVSAHTVAPWPEATVADLMTQFYDQRWEGLDGTATTFVVLANDRRQAEALGRLRLRNLYGASGDAELTLVENRERVWHDVEQVKEFLDLETAAERDLRRAQYQTRQGIP